MKISFPHRAGSPARRVACERSCLERRDADGLGALVPGLRLELHARALGERTEAVAQDRAVVDEEVLAAFVRRDEPEALVVVEPLDDSCGHGVYPSAGVLCTATAEDCYEATTCGRSALLASEALPRTLTSRTLARIAAEPSRPFTTRSRERSLPRAPR